jgi:aminoglycoside phosphotransferase family enzyme
VTSGLLPRALLDPAAYPHRPESVTVKKPVTFPFVDYGTLARRREFCEEEVRRSRRFARDIYLGVVAIVARGDDGLAIEPAGDPLALEYAVEMRRYDQSATLAARLAAGTLAEADLVAAGRAVAGFHAAAEPAGGARRLTRIVEETLATLEAAGVPLARLEGIRHFLRGALEGFGPSSRGESSAAARATATATCAPSTC